MFTIRNDTLLSTALIMILCSKEHKWFIWAFYLAKFVVLLLVIKWCTTGNWIACLKASWDCPKTDVWCAVLDFNNTLAIITSTILENSLPIPQICYFMRSFTISLGVTDNHQDINIFYWRAHHINFRKKFLVTRDMNLTRISPQCDTNLLIPVMDERWLNLCF